MSRAIFLIENPPTQPSESKISGSAKPFGDSTANATQLLSQSNILPAEIAEALVMLDLFFGLGVTTFFRTILDRTGTKVAFRRHPSVHSLRRELRNLFPVCHQRQWNLIVRPVAPLGISLVQLDDLSSSQLDRVIPFSFLALETSPRNFQAWLAVQDADPDLVRRIKRAAGADPGASGATRLAGSFNFKSKYAPHYPKVRLQSVAPQRLVTLAELDYAGLLTTAGQPILNSEPASANNCHPMVGPCRTPYTTPRHHPLTWPSYARCLSGAPQARNHEGKDRSAADFAFCLISIDRGWSVEETANHLMAESEKARSVGLDYARFTAKRAASIVHRNW